MTGETIETVIIGAGFSGLSAAHELLTSGRNDFVLLEQASEVGGVWRDNQYPNAACDVPAQLYSLSFAPNAEWSCNYAPWHEILAYMNKVVDDLGIRDRIRFETELVAATWEHNSGEWLLTLADASTIRCRFLISAVGALSRPLIPDLPGMDEFRGEILHTAHWHPDVRLEGKRVAVIGAGASAVQVVPYAVDTAAEVLSVVRTPPYVMPKPEEHYDEAAKARFRAKPEEMDRKRKEHYDFFTVSTDAQAAMDTTFLDKVEADWRDHLESAVADPDLRRLLTPNYRWGCRRPVVSNVYYPALADPKTTVWDVGIVAFTPTGVVGSDGREWDADVVILATGFRGTELFEGVDYTGIGGRQLRKEWASEPQAWKGTLVYGFPNLFLITGPNTQASGSIIGIIEAQTRMVVALIDLADRAGASSVAVTEDAQRRYNEWLDAVMAGTVWQIGGCASWYRVGGTGKVVTKYPGSLASFEAVTSDLDPDDLELTVLDRAAADTEDRSRATT
ncbi:flavin-containing monooxygenase [Amycolatopsis pithecellobii]|uniref:NAD(P)-binding protein n=1 Tax=Amycolatopsis pithecellobii TaxID=664692 RepID=A0A6N7YXW4_9PSEU|nr:NAD(P)/FAD-dependent oxidoreductase [Amycolatopsis pithecellobii]MTD53733.1 NAD(P)-binding protein [Amycolatopsis pithecellobii]